jgi:hypothetical protein
MVYSLGQLPLICGAHNIQDAPDHGMAFNFIRFLKEYKAIEAH